MVEISIKLKLRHGLHMRPAAIFVAEAVKFKSKIRVFNGDQVADGKSVMGMITLGLTYGSTMKIIADGVDEKKAIEHLKKVVLEKLDEGA